MPAADVLADIDPNQLGQRGQLLLLEAWERQARWVAARQQAVLAAVAGPAPDPQDDDWVSMDVAATLRLAPSTADRRLAVARWLSGPPPIGGYSMLTSRKGLGRFATASAIRSAHLRSLVQRR